MIQLSEIFKFHCFLNDTRSRNSSYWSSGEVSCFSSKAVHSCGQAAWVSIDFSEVSSSFYHILRLVSLLRICSWRTECLVSWFVVPFFIPKLHIVHGNQFEKRRILLPSQKIISGTYEAFWLLHSAEHILFWWFSVLLRGFEINFPFS